MAPVTAHVPDVSSELARLLGEEAAFEVVGAGTGDELVLCVSLASCTCETVETGATTGKTDAAIVETA